MHSASAKITQNEIHCGPMHSIDMKRVHDIVRLEPRSTLPSESSGARAAKSKFLKTLAERGTLWTSK